MLPRCLPHTLNIFLNRCQYMKKMFCIKYFGELVNKKKSIFTIWIQMLYFYKTYFRNHYSLAEKSLKLFENWFQNKWIALSYSSLLTTHFKCSLLFWSMQINKKSISWISAISENYFERFVLKNRFTLIYLKYRMKNSTSTKYSKSF